MKTEAKNLGPVNTMSKKNHIKPILIERGLFVQARGKFRSPKEFVKGSIPGQAPGLIFLKHRRRIRIREVAG